MKKVVLFVAAFAAAAFCDGFDSLEGKYVSGVPADTHLVFSNALICKIKPEIKRQCIDEDTIYCADIDSVKNYIKRLARTNH